MFLTLQMRHTLLLFLLATLSGCASMLAPMSETPTDQDHGKRTFGAKVEDHNIERKTKINLYRSAPNIRDDGKVKVISINGNVLLVGEVADQTLQQDAGKIAKQIRHVRSVHNEVAVREKASVFSNISDTWITTKTKTRLLLASQVPGRRTKVVTRRGVVYIMGLMTKAEADAVVKRVQRVYGVQKIVKIIEYTDIPEA